MRGRVITLSFFIVTLCALWMAPVGAEQVGWWRLDETSGMVAADSSGRGRDGTIAGTPAWAAGKRDGAMQLSGDDSVTLPAANMGLRSTAGSVAFWMNAGNPTAIRTIFWAGDNTTGGGFGPENEIHVHVEMAGTYWRGGEMSFYTPNSHIHSDPQKGAAGTAPVNPILVTDNQWHHVAATWGGPDGNVKLFIDGALISSLAYSPADWACTNLFLGRMANSSRFYAGLLDDVRVYNHAMTAAEVFTAMMGVSPGAGSSPNPGDGATDVPTDTNLTWKPGAFPGKHDVYFSASFDDVNEATRTSSRGVLVSQGQDANAYDPVGRFALGQTYYWRVDEVNSSPDATIYRGNVWSFTAEPKSYPVAGVTATASGQSKPDMGPEKTVDRSGLNSNDEHSTTAADGWLSEQGSSAWIQYDLGGLYSLDKMQVWNSNQGMEFIIGFGAKNVKVEYSSDAAAWITLGDFEFARAPGADTYIGDILVDFGGAAARHVKLTITKNWSILVQQYGLSEVRFYYVPVTAREAKPAPGATDVHPQVHLDWRAGRDAASHEVYLGNDEQAVTDGTVAPVTVAQPGYDVSLTLDATYYWKVVEVNQASAPGAWSGDVWSFSTMHYITVEDFESYTNDSPKRVFQTWIDGGGFSADSFFPNGGSGNGTGSYAGYDPAAGDIMETASVYGGKQAMPLFYDNGLAPKVSEAERTFAATQDWSKYGVTTLVLFFRGDVNNVGAPLYIKINGTKVLYNGGAAATTSGLWRQWNIPLASVPGLNLTSIRTLTIGVGDGASGGTGTIIVDEIRLYATPPQIAVAADPGTNGLAALYAMNGDVQDSSGRNLHGTANGEPAYRNGPAGMGQALAFDGTNDYVALPIGSLISTSSSMTLAGWVNYANAGGNWQRVFDFGLPPASGNPNTYMFLTPENATTSSPRFAIRTAAIAEQAATSGWVFPAGWHHLAVVIDSASMTIRLYQDGRLVAGGPTLLLPKDLGSTTQNWLGRSQWTADAYLNGSIDEFRIYDRALSEGEVRYLAGDR